MSQVWCTAMVATLRRPLHMGQAITDNTTSNRLAAAVLQTAHQSLCEATCWIQVPRPCSCAYIGALAHAHLCDALIPTLDDLRRRGTSTLHQLWYMTSDTNSCTYLWAVSRLLHCDVVASYVEEVICICFWAQKVACSGDSCRCVYKLQPEAANMIHSTPSPGPHQW